ncbi:alpha/beta-hydrolase [Trametes sanguinea]|nr:alpha/beta-hydrolase [Trametes sanguinea]
MSTAAATSTVKTLRSSDGTVIHAEAVGNPRNPPVVFLHEVTLCSAVFDEVFYDRRLAEHLYLVRYDLRCHGRSGMAIHPDGQHPARHGEDFTAVVNAFGLRRPIVVAWGFGAAIAGDICASSSHNPISGVVFIAPLPFLDPRLPRSATERMLGLTQLLRSSQDTVITARAKTELVNGFFAGSTRQVPDMLRSAWLGYSIAQPPEATQAILAAPHDPSKLLEAGRQGLPLMLLLGSNDALVDCPAVASELRRHFRNAEAHVVEGGSHALFFDKHAEFVKLLLVFVGRLAVMTLMS